MFAASRGRPEREPIAGQFTGGQEAYVRSAWLTWSLKAWTGKGSAAGVVPAVPQYCPHTSQEAEHCACGFASSSRAAGRGEACVSVTP